MFLCSYYSEPAAEETQAAASKEKAGESGADPTGSGGTPEDLIAWFNTAIKEYDAFFLIYYRGLW